MIEGTQLERLRGVDPSLVGCEDGALGVPQARVADVVGQLEPAALVERDLREAIESRSVERIEAVLERKKMAPA